MSVASQYIPHYTLADYDQWEGDWELWQGVAVSLLPPNTYQHQSTAMDLFTLIVEAIKATGTTECELICGVDWRISNDTVVRPDQSIIRLPIETDWLEEPPLLIAEILSINTAEKDRKHKRALYAREGVGYYLIVDPEAERIETFKLNNGQYEYADPDSICLTETCTISIDARKIWPVPLASRTRI